jgi:hypothetical protein
LRRVFLDANPCEPLWLQDGLGNHTIDEREETDAKADQVLIEAKWYRAHCGTTELD